MNPTNDIGTRVDHYSDLIDMWETGLEIVRRYQHYSDDDKANIAKLEAAIELATIQRDRITGYQKGQFSDDIPAQP